MQRTNNYQFKKPEGEDYILVEDLNFNMDAIDKLIKAINDQLSNLGSDGETLKDLLAKKADLDEYRKVVKDQMPDLDKYRDILMYNTRGNFPNAGDGQKLYLAKNTDTLYRYDGQYIEISKPLSVGTNQGQAFDGKRGYDLERAFRALSYYTQQEVDDLIKNAKNERYTKAEVDAKLRNQKAERYTKAQVDEMLKNAKQEVIAEVKSNIIDQIIALS